MATGKEIKRLRGKKTSASEAANLIGVGVDRLRKWEERDTDPSDSGDIQKVEQYFGCKLDQLTNIEIFDFVEMGQKVDYKDKYIRLQEKYSQLLESSSDSVADLIKQNQALIMTVQEVLARLMAKSEKRNIQDIASLLNKVNTRNLSEVGSLKIRGI